MTMDEKMRRQREYVYENEERRSAAKLQEMLSEAKAREVLAEHGDRRDANTQQRIHRQKELEVTIQGKERLWVRERTRNQQEIQL